MKLGLAVPLWRIQQLFCRTDQHLATFCRSSVVLEHLYLPLAGFSTTRRATVSRTFDRPPQPPPSIAPLDPCAARRKPHRHGQEQRTGGPKELGTGKEMGRRKRQDRERAWTGKELGTLKAVRHWEDSVKALGLVSAKGRMRTGITSTPPFLSITEHT